MAQPCAPLTGALRNLFRGLDPADQELLIGPARADLARRQPFVLAIEDLHGAESSTLDLVDFLSRNLAGMPMLVVLTYRTDEIHRSHPLRPALAERRRPASVRVSNILAELAVSSRTQAAAVAHRARPATV